jgi:hypothetical protein
MKGKKESAGTDVKMRVGALSRLPAENPNPVMRMSKDGTIL